MSKVQTEEFDLPLVNAKAGSNGIMYYGRSSDWESDTMTIDIVNDGAVSAGMVYAQPQATGTLYNAYQIKLKSDVFSEMTEAHLLYLATTIQKSIQRKFSYSNKAVWSRVGSETIQLPVKEGTDEVNYSEEDIDWDYMEARIRELDAYLQSTGLNTIELTDEEETILDIVRTFGEFKIGDLFDGITGDTDIKKVHLDGEGYPVITAGVDNLGVAGYSSINAKILPANSLTVDMFGNCYFRPFEYKMVTHARVFALVLKDGEMTTEIGLFLCLMLQWLRHMHHYSNMCSYNKIKESIIKLPLKLGTDIRNFSETDIDWDYMDATIRITEKRVISDVVDYKDAVIAKTKELVQ